MCTFRFCMLHTGAGWMEHSAVGGCSCAGGVGWELTCFCLSFACGLAGCLELVLLRVVWSEGLRLVLAFEDMMRWAPSWRLSCPLRNARMRLSCMARPSLIQMSANAAYLAYTVLQHPLELLSLSQQEFTFLLALSRAHIRKHRLFCSELHAGYHLQPGGLKSPQLGLAELVMRLVFEFFTGRVQLDDFTGRRPAWRRAPGRGGGHQQRVEILIECIAHCPVARRTARDCKWLRL